MTLQTLKRAAPALGKLLRVAFAAGGRRVKERSMGWKLAVSDKLKHLTGLLALFGTLIALGKQGKARVTRTTIRSTAECGTMREWPFGHHGLHLTASTSLHPEAAWQPAVDLYRCAGGWMLKFELAGVRQEDIQVRIDSQGITVSGTRFDRRPYELQEAYLIEIAYSRFERSVALPEPMEDVQYRIEFHDGMLYVQVLRNRDESVGHRE